MPIDYDDMKKSMAKFNGYCVMPTGNVLEQVLTELAETQTCRDVVFIPTKDGVVAEGACGTCIICLAKRWAEEQETAEILADPDIMAQLHQSEEDIKAGRVTDIHDIGDLDEPDIIQNAIRCPDGTILKSTHRHDFQEHEGIFIDGGLAYFRSGGDQSQCEDLRLTSDSGHDEIDNRLIWGTHGKSGDEPLQYVKLRDCTDDHLAAILKLDHIGDVCRDTIKRIQLERAKG